MFRKLLFTAFLVFFVRADEEPTKYELCATPASVGEVLSVSVDPCPKAPNGGCILKRNHTVNINIDFKPSENLEELKHQVHGMILGAAMPYFGLGGPNACAKIEPKPEPCKLEAGETYYYRSTMSILPSYPEISLQVRWQLLGPGNTVQVCVLIPIKISS